MFAFIFILPILLYFVNVQTLYENASGQLALYTAPLDMDKYITLEQDFNEPNDVIPVTPPPTPANVSLITLDRPLPWYLSAFDWVRELVNNFIKFWTFKPRN